MELLRDRYETDDGPQLWSASADEADDELAVLEGWAVTYRDTPNYSGRIVVPGAFKQSLKQRPSARKPLPIGYEHSTLGGTNPVGRWGKATDDPDRGVFLSEGRLSKTTQGRDVSTLVRDKVLTGLSVGFIPTKIEEAVAGEEREFKTPYGKRAYQVEHDCVFVTEGQLMETSVVSAPADDEARLTKVQSLVAIAESAAAGRAVTQALELVRDGLDGHDGQLSREGCALLIKIARDVVPGRLGALTEPQRQQLRQLVADLDPFLLVPSDPTEQLAAELRSALETVRS